MRIQLLHIFKQYATGQGHIEELDNCYLITFYMVRQQGSTRRVFQQVRTTLQDARFTLRQMAL